MPDPCCQSEILSDLLFPVVGSSAIAQDVGALPADQCSSMIGILFHHPPQPHPLEPHHQLGLGLTSSSSAIQFPFVSLFAK
jgi:hypothetical protein